MMTIYEDNGMIFCCGKDEKVTSMSGKEFMSGKFLDIFERESSIFVYNFQMLAMFFIKALLDLGFSDATLQELSYVNNHKLDNNCVKYLLSGESRAFYSVSYNNHGRVTNLYEFKNMVSAGIDDVVKDFGGETCVAMYRAVLSIRSYANRATTISSAAYSHWKAGYEHSYFERSFIECSEEAEKICRDAYHGGLCQIADGKNNRYFKNGIVLDVNSLYPFVMKTKRFAVGEEHYVKGDLPDEIRNSSKIAYYVRFKAAFEVKENHIPFVRTRCDKRHWQLETLSTSAYIDADGNRYDFVNCPGVEYIDEWGEIHQDVMPMTVELCMYKPEFELFFEQYDVSYIEVIEYVWWNTRKDIFSGFVDEFYQMKKTAKGKAEKRIAKIFLNALSGRMSLKTERTNLYFGDNAQEIIDDFGSFDYKQDKGTSRGKYTKEYMADTLDPIIGGKMDVTSRSQSHIQIGAAITSEAMCYIVRKAQANYDHFLYTDTDSLHLDCMEDQVNDVKIGEELGQFKVEKKFMFAIYYKEKVYTIFDDSARMRVTWAGMPAECQDMLEKYLTHMFHMKKSFSWMYKGMYSKKDQMLSYLAKQVMDARPEGLSDNDWDWFLRCAYTKDAWDIYGLRIPRVKRVVKSYKNFEFGTETEWYKVDTFAITC